MLLGEHIKSGSGGFLEDGKGGVLLDGRLTAVPSGGHGTSMCYGCSYHMEMQKVRID